MQSVATTGTPTASFRYFRKLAIELQNLIWQETFSQPRVFDDSTLSILNPRNGIMYSYLTPYALGVCRDSRTFAQSRLCRTFLFRKLVQEVFGKRGVKTVTSQEIPEAERISKAFIATFPAHSISLPDSRDPKYRGTGRQRA